MTAAITVEGLGKRFRIYDADRPGSLKEAFLRGKLRPKRAESVWALRNVDFVVPRGQIVGVVGRNGAGKSTLLRVVGGVLRPDEGHVEVNGRIGALIEPNSGFHPDLTGRENVFCTGVIAGLTRAEVARRFDAIVDFAELERFIDYPVRTYSSGMQMRLAFAVAAHTDHEILLVDEVLAVGDFAFQKKCLDRITQFRDDGGSVLLVSHDSTLVEQLGQAVLWLRAGRVASYGSASRVVAEYIADVEAETRRRTPSSWPSSETPGQQELRVHENRFGSLEMELVTVRLLDSEGSPVTELKGGDSLRIEMDYLAPGLIDAPIFKVTISREDGLVCSEVNTAASNITLPRVRGRGTVTLVLDRVDLCGGQYYVDVAVFERNWSYAYDSHWHVYPFRVRAAAGENGVLRVPHHWEGTVVPAAEAPKL